MGNPRLSNMVLMGAFAKAGNLMDRTVIANALHAMLGEKKSVLIEKNRAAIDLGWGFLELKAVKGRYSLRMSKSMKRTFKLWPG